MVSMRELRTPCRKKRVVRDEMEFRPLDGVFALINGCVAWRAGCRAARASQPKTPTSQPMPVSAIVRAGLLVAVAAACQPSPDFVVVALQMPPGLEFDGFRITQLQPGDGGAVTAMTETPVSDGGTKDGHSFGMRKPGLGATLELSVQAYGRMNDKRHVLAEGRGQVVAGQDLLVINLGVCASAPELLATFAPCPDAPDGGADARPKAPSLTASDGGSSQDAWMAPVCQNPADPPELSPPHGGPAPSQECVDYCDAITTNCGFVFATREHCLYACAVIDPPPSSTHEPDDTIACRTVWARSAGFDGGLPLDQNRRCRQAAPTSDRECGNPCFVYCRIGTKVCPQHFPPEGDCDSACIARANRLGDIRPLLACRNEWLEKAIFNSDLCSWAAPYNDCGPAGGTCPPVYFDR
jgi:hypothetical protein